MLHTGGDGKNNGVGIMVLEEISKDVVRVGGGARKEDHYCMDDGEKATFCALYLCMGLKQEGWRQRKGPSGNSWRKWWNRWKRVW